MPVVPFIPAIIGAGASIGGAAIASHGASSAANTQAASADKAAQIQREMYEKYRSDMAPYRVAGYNSLGQLSQLLGLGPMKLPDPKDTIGANTTPQAPTGTLSQRTAAAGIPPGRRLGAMFNADKRAQLENELRNQPGSGYSQPQAQGATFASMTGGGQAGSGLVTMRAPDGTTQSVPQDQVAHYLQLGAQVVPGAA